jgi:hypothetical protein
VRIRAVDLDHAADGHLVAADGRLNFVHGLDVIARDTIRAGVRIVWGQTPNGEPACSYLRSRVIVLSPALYDEEPIELKTSWSHELAHCVCGTRSERETWFWQLKHYGEWISEPWAA